MNKKSENKKNMGNQKNLKSGDKAPIIAKMNIIPMVLPVDILVFRSFINNKLPSLTGFVK